MVKLGNYCTFTASEIYQYWKVYCRSSQSRCWERSEQDRKVTHVRRVVCIQHQYWQREDESEGMCRNVHCIFNNNEPHSIDGWRLIKISKSVATVVNKKKKEKKKEKKNYLPLRQLLIGDRRDSSLMYTYTRYRKVLLEVLSFLAQRYRMLCLVTCHRRFSYSTYYTV
jgi:hypothetical protein